MKTRKIKKTFSLTKEQKKKKGKFCQNIFKKKIKGENIFFTDETQIKLGSYTNDFIRLSEENEKKLKTGDVEVLSDALLKVKSIKLQFLEEIEIDFNDLTFIFDIQAI